MGQTNKIIEINGKRYDAVTGTCIGDSLEGVTTTAHTQPNTNRSHGGSIDGFRRVRRESVPTVLTPIPAVKKIQTTPQAAVTHKPHLPAPAAKVHAPQKATTLMRTAVKKPNVQSVAVIKSQTRTDILAKVPAQQIVPKFSYNSVNKPRIQRAERMVKSSAVSRYGAPTRPNLSAALPVQTPMVQKPATAQPAVVTPVPAPLPTTPNNHRPRSMSGVVSRPAQFQRSGQANLTAQSQPAMSLQAPPVAKKDLPDIFEKALAGAKSHEQTFSKKKTRSKKTKVFAYAGSSLAILLIVGFFVSANTPQLSMKVAAYRAGLDAKLPTYAAAGFGFSNLDYKPGNVVVNYASSSTSEAYKISQKPSNWDSQALLSNFVAVSKDSSYKTYQRAGRTIYVMSDNTATWVDSGIWYTVNGDASLSSSQLLDLASSM